MDNTKEDVAFNGQCAFAVSLGKKDVKGNPRCFSVKDGKKYLFSNSIAKMLWLLIPGRRAHSEKKWAGRS